MIQLAGPANKQARIAADNALGRRTIFKGAQGTAIVKVFDLTVAVTGASEKILRQNNIPHIISYTHSASHASYYPGANMMAIKLIFSPSSGRILGSQIVGINGVDKRIDVLATAIRGGLTVYDLEELELAYSPPYGSAKDPINIAGYAASNILKGDSENVYPKDIEKLDPDKDVLIDLRTKKEIDESGSIPGSIHIPIDKLRDELPKLDRSKRYILYCAIGLRGYLGYRIMSQHGFKAKNLSGGYKTFVGSK
jgi:rhodanese-related sulfurtransferase